MKKKILTLYLILFAISNFAYASRTLSSAEILEIFKSLTDQPAKTWIKAGSLEADHFEYKKSTGYMVESAETVKYDGERFYWRINTKSHTRLTNFDVNDPLAGLDEDIDWARNAERIFIWDGQAYTLYFKSGQNAIVSERTSLIPMGVNGPLTAAVIPWGYGIYTYEMLEAMEPSALEQEVDGQKQIHLTLKNQQIPQMRLVLDPAKNYAVLFHSIDFGGAYLITKTYEDYKSVAGRWLPSVITIQRYDNTKPAPEIQTYDRWQFTYTSPISPSFDVFKIGYDDNTLVQYYSSLIPEPVSYKHNSRIDTDMLLQRKFAFELDKDDTKMKNCATFAMKYVSEILGRDVNDQQLASLVQPHDNRTNFFDLLQFAKGLGFYCLAINRIDIQTLKNLKDSQCIAYLPQQKHYVIIASVDDENVWLIDFNLRKFLYPVKIDKFISDLEDGAALLVSSAPMETIGNLSQMSENDMRQISGGSTKYSCTDTFQTAKVQFCSETSICVGSRYRVWQWCKKCQEDENGGDCFGQASIGNYWCDCIEDPDNPGVCTWSSDWYVQYIRACECSMFP